MVKLTQIVSQNPILNHFPDQPDPEVYQAPMNSESDSVLTRFLIVCFIFYVGCMDILTKLFWRVGLDATKGLVYPCWESCWVRVEGYTSIKSNKLEQNHELDLGGYGVVN